MACSPAVINSDYVFSDWLGAQRRECRALRPHCREALVAWMQEQEDLTELRLRAVGSGHSTSDVARPPSATAIAVIVDDLVIHEEEAQAAERWTRSATLAPGEHLIRVPGGMTIASLNEELKFRTWALPNMGSYDAQTISGAIATGTHGSGLVTGPLPDIVASIELVTVLRGPRVAALRIEPADGPTDPTLFDGQRFGLELMQDTEAFESCVVGLGAFGVVTAVTLKVVDAFWLAEERWMTTWPELAAGRTLLDLVEREPYVDVVMTPLPRPNNRPRNHRCLVTVRRRIPPDPEEQSLPQRNDARRKKLEIQARLHQHRENPQLSLTHMLAAMSSNLAPLGNYLADGALEEEAEQAQENPLRSASHIVLRTSVGDLVLATSAEVAVPLERSVDAVEATIEHLAEIYDDQYYHGSPIGIRFGAASRHHISMHYGRPTCTIETPILLGMRRLFHPITDSEADISFMLRAFTNRILADDRLEARVHWGQRGVPGREQIVRAYPQFAIWERQMRRFNPYGIFDNRLVSDIVALQPSPRSNLQEASWMHAHDASIEYPERLESLWRAGFYLSLQGRAGSQTWLHFAIPTPATIDDQPPRVGSVMLRFRTGSTVAHIGSVHVYDGERKIATHNGLNGTAESWRFERFDVPENPGIRWGLGISVKVVFPSGAATADEKRIDISSVGCDFLP